MAMFTIRVELHGAESKHYDLLAELLAPAAISNIVTADDGSRYRLPSGEFDWVGEATKEEVLDAIAAAADHTQLQYSILISQATERIWANLPAAE